jgi:uncharacterized glyoxalase superfamily protein PhnB
MIQDRPTIIPRIVTRDVGSVVGFIKLVFGAAGELQTSRPTELRLGNSVIMVSDGGGMREPRPAFLYVYVSDVDETYRLALTAGALEIEAPAEMPYGDRRATVQDPWDNIWQIAMAPVSTES